MENGISEYDPFSWHENLPYTYPHWGYDVATYLIYSVGQNIIGETGGYIAIYISTIILASILGILLFRINKKIGKNTIISFIITLLAIYSIRDYIAARAQLVTFILFIFEIYCIETFLEKPRKRYIIGLILIPILIANLHVAVWWFYFILYIPYIAEYIIAKILKKDKEIVLNKIEINSNKNTQYIIILMIICLLTGLITPLGDAPYTYLIKTMNGNTTKNINEHLPMTLIEHTEPLIAVIALVILLVCTPAKITLRDVFMSGGLILLMWYSKRQESLFFLIGCIIFNKLHSIIIKIAAIAIKKAYTFINEKLLSHNFPNFFLDTHPFMAIELIKIYIKSNTRKNGTSINTPYIIPLIPKRIINTVISKIDE